MLVNNLHSDCHGILKCVVLKRKFSRDFKHMFISYHIKKQKTTKLNRYSFSFQLNSMYKCGCVTGNLFRKKSKCKNKYQVNFYCGKQKTKCNT